MMMNKGTGVAGRGADTSGIQRVHAGRASALPPAHAKGVGCEPSPVPECSCSWSFCVSYCLSALLACVQDGCGNKLDSEVERLKDVSVEVVSGPTDDGSAPEVIQDLQASFQVLDSKPMRYSDVLFARLADSCHIERARPMAASSAEDRMEVLQVAEDQGRVLIKSAQVLGCNLGSVTSVFAGSPTPNPVSIPQVRAAARLACRHRHHIIVAKKVFSSFSACCV